MVTISPDISSAEPVCCLEIITVVDQEKGKTVHQRLEQLNELYGKMSKSMDEKCIGKINYLKSNYYRILGNYDSAEMLIAQAKEIFTALNDSTSTAEAINLEGTIKMATSDYEKALVLFIDALNYGENNRDSLWTAVVYINIGNIYLSRKNYEKALTYFLSTLRIYEKTDKVLMKIKILNNLGSTYEKLKRNKDARIHFDRALAYARQEKDSFSISFISQNIGHMLVQEGDFSQAKIYFETALPLAKTHNDTYGVAYSLLGLGMGYHGLKEYGLAKSKLDSAIQLASEISANDLLQDAYKHLYKIDSISGSFAIAFSNYQKFKALQDSAIWVVKNKDSEDMLDRFEARQRLKDNEILQAKNNLQEEKLTKQSYVIAFVIIILLIMAVSFHHTRKINILLIKNAQTVELQKCKLEQQARELLMGNKVTQEINANLEKIVESRTLKINQQNTALRNYEFENSHSIRGPLARILGLVSLFEVHNLTDEQKLLISSIENSAKELDDIIKNMSKILGKA